MKLTTAMILTIDTETTGTSTKEDRVVELGAVYLQGGEERGPRLRALVDPERYIPAGATGVHGIRDQDVEGAPKWPEVAARLKVHIDQSPVMCGYNILFFDAPLIDAENERCGVDWKMPRSLDPFLWVYWFDRGVQSKKLGITCERYGVILSAEEAHTADADAYATGLLLTALVQDGMIPNDVEAAFSEQDHIQQMIDQEREIYGRAIFPDRDDGRYRLGMGKHCGTLIDEADESYLKWLLGRPDLTEKTKGILLKATGQTEQIGLF